VSALAAWKNFPEKKTIFAKAKIRGLPNDVRTAMECLGVGKDSYCPWCRPCKKEYIFAK
jgi:hypothetical protein